MSQRYRWEGGQDGTQRPSRGSTRGTERHSHQESDEPGSSDERTEEPRTSTRTEEIDRHEGLCPDSEKREDEDVPEERQDRIEFLEQLYLDDDSLAPARRDELLREGCDANILALERSQPDEGEE